MALPRYVWPLAAAAIATGAIVLSGREPVGPGGRPILRDATAYQAENAKVRELTLPVFAKADTGGEVTAEEAKGLEAAIPHLQAMNGYAPIKVGPYFALGKCYQLLGRPEDAGRAYEQAIANEPADFEEKDSPDLKATVVEAKALLAECLLDVALQSDGGPGRLPPDELRRRALSWATEAVKVQPNAPRYLAAQASALLALRREDEAKPIVERAKAIAPDHFRVRPLVKLMGL